MTGKSKSHLLRPSWFRSRRYLHFDCPISFRDAGSYVLDQRKIARHPFLPFLSYVKSISRYRSSEHKVVNKERLICYASHTDSLVYSYYAAQLSQLLEAQFEGTAIDSSVLAYRSLGKSNIDFAADVIEQIRMRKTCVVKAFDIHGFFDHIDHSLLKEYWCALLDVARLPPDHFNVFKSISEFARVDREQLYSALNIDSKSLPEGIRRLCTSEEFRMLVRGGGLISVNRTGVGIPQGSPISAVLSNLYLLAFDRTMVSLASRIGGIYRRYSDDILWICAVGDEAMVETETRTAIEAVRLRINCDKTETAMFQEIHDERITSDKAMQYLGFTFDGERVLIRSQTMARYYRRVHSRINRARRIAAKSMTDTRVFRREIYEDFTHLGRRAGGNRKKNFITGYASQAVAKLNSDAIRRQIGKHWRNIHKWLPDDH